MKKILYTLIALSSILAISFAQITNQIAEKSISDKVDIPKSYPIHGSHLLIEKENKLREYYAQNPHAQKFPLSKPTDWGFTVGSTKEWWAEYIEEQDIGAQQYLVPSTCRAVGTNCYIFVEDAVWNSNRIDQDAVDAIVDAFDNSTPADAPNNDGIYNVDTRTFGAPPNVDNDDKIIILVLDIQDGYSGSGGYIAGYFYSLNERPDSPGIDGFRSNEAEIFYMDCDPADLITDLPRVLNTTAHEFQHMIHFAHDENEMTFINEALSEIASHICGYSLRGNGLYAQNPNRSLLSWDGVDALPDYARASHWMLYIYEQYPNSDILKDFVNRTHGNYASIDNTLRGVDQSRGFFNVFEEWLIANYVNGSSNDPRYGYQYSPRTQSTPVATHIGNNGEGSGTLNPLSAEYITFRGGDDLSITFTGDAIYKIRALKIGSLEVENVDKNEEYTPSGYGTTYPEVTFLLYNDSPGSSQNYTYSATGTSSAGTMEIFYEDGEPDGYAPAGTWAHPGDSVAVKFDGIAGAILDSVRFAFRRNGTIQMDICDFDGTTSLRGNSLFGPVSIISNDSTTITNNSYPIPYDNWVTVDLTNQNIGVSNDFVVSLLLGENTSEPGIMVSAEDISGHSYWYDSTSDSWISYTETGTGKYWNYFIRAYVHWGTLDIELDQNGIVSIPDNFSLRENYPNPFNPTTTFEFAIPKDDLVKFTVHDLLGREIYSENRNLLAGSYSFNWDGQNNLNQQVVSGVYFLKMETDGFSKTRKMSLLR